MQTKADIEMSLVESRLGFDALKQAVEARFRESHPGLLSPIREWKGQQITNFQEDLMDKAQGRISEKWFYTHIKPLENTKLPRIDMLDLLSQYIGRKNWEDFQSQGGMMIETEKAERKIEVKTKMQEAQPKKKFGLVRMIAWLGMAAVVVFSGMMIWAGFAMQNKMEYEICFVDADTHKPIKDAGKIELKLIGKTESPEKLKCSAGACVKLEVQEQVELEVKAPYYKTTTLKRDLPEEGGQETIELQTDDYALMIHYFSTGNIKDWKKRRRQLNEMFSNDAKIFQVMDNRGIEMYNKSEFVDKMSMPINSLRDIEILKTEYDDKGKIIRLRFIQLSITN